MVDLPSRLTAYLVLGLVSLLAVGLSQAEAQITPRPVPEAFSEFRGEPRFPNNILFRGRQFPAEIFFGRQAIFNQPLDQRETSVLSPEQQQRILNDHLLAWRQANVALQYLRANGRAILDGQDELYNRTFGRFYDRSVSNPLLGKDFVDQPAVTVRRNNPIGIVEDLEADDQDQDGQVIQEGFTIEFEEETFLPRTLEVGDFVVIGNEEFGREVHRVIGMQTGDEQDGQQDQDQQAQVATGPDRGQFLQSLTLEKQPFADFVTEDTEITELEVNEVLNDITVVGDQVETGRRVVNRDHYNRVVETFEAIRDLLERDTTYLADPEVIGGDPDDVLEMLLAGADDAEGAQTPFDRIFQTLDELPQAAGPDDGDGQAVDGPFDEIFSFDGAAFDRAFRQFGFSNSLSEEHLEQLRNNPEDPLLWTEEEREFFINQHLTLFTEGGLLGTGIAVSAMDGELEDEVQEQLTQRLLRRGFNSLEIQTVLQRIQDIQEAAEDDDDGTADFTSLLGNTVYLGGGFLNEVQRSKGGLFETRPIDNHKPTDLLQFQMLVAAFGESDEAGLAALGQLGLMQQMFGERGAGFGIAEIMQALGFPNGNRDLPFPQNRDADRFGRFADIFGSPRIGNSIGDGSQVPPEGKNAVALPREFEFLSADFTPVIPAR